MLFNKLNSSKKKCLNKICTYKINYSGGSSSTNRKITKNEFLDYFIDHTNEMILNNEHIHNLNVTNKIKIDINFNDENIKSELKIDNNILIIKESLLNLLFNIGNVQFRNFVFFLNDLSIKKKIDDIFIIYIEKDENNEINKINKNKTKENINENNNFEYKGKELDEEDESDEEDTEDNINEIFFFKTNFFENINFCNILIYNNEIYFKDPMNEIINEHIINKDIINEDISYEIYIGNIYERLEYLNSIYKLDLKFAKDQDISKLQTQVELFLLSKL